MNSLATLIQSFHPVWLYGSEKAPDTSIQWVCGWDDSPGPGDLVLLESGKHLTDHLDGLVQADVSAIGIIGSTDWKPSAAMNRTPIFLLGQPPDSLRTVQRELLTMLLSSKAALTDRTMRMQSRLTQIVARSEGLPGLAAALCEMTQHSALIQDKRLAPLASSPAAGLRSIWEDLLERLEEFSSLPESFRDRRQAGQTTAATREILPGGLERVIVPIVAGDMARGFLSIVALEGELDDTDTIAAEQGAMVCAIEMARAKAVRETEKRLHVDLLSALLHQTLSARDAQLWAHNTGLDLDQAHTAIRLSWEGSSPSIRRLETVLHEEAVRRALRIIVSPMGGEVIAFYESPRGTARPVDAIAFAQAVMDRATQEHPHSVLRCGIGTPAEELAAWQVSFRQAGQSLEMAGRLDERKPLYFMDLSVYRLLLQIEDHPDLRVFLEETLGPLLAHENAADFLATLEEYFMHNGNVSQTAEALCIHRNTLLYRMERIAAISKLDLDNPDTRLAVQLALHIRRMLRPAA